MDVSLTHTQTPTAAGLETPIRRLKKKKKLLADNTDYLWPQGNTIFLQQDISAQTTKDELTHLSILKLRILHHQKTHERWKGQRQIWRGYFQKSCQSSNINIYIRASKSGQGQDRLCYWQLGSSLQWHRKRANSSGLKDQSRSPTLWVIRTMQSATAGGYSSLPHGTSRWHGEQAGGELQGLCCSAVRTLLHNRREGLRHLGKCTVRASCPRSPAPRGCVLRRSLSQRPHLDRPTGSGGCADGWMVPLVAEKAVGLLRATQLVQSLEKFPVLPPPCVVLLSPGLSSWLRGCLWPSAFLPVPRAHGGVCQGAAGTQWGAGRGGGQCHAELRGGPGPDGGDVVQGRQEAEWELESARGGQGLHPASGAAAGGEGGQRGVQLRGRGPEGLLPPGCHRSVTWQGDVVTDL